MGAAHRYIWAVFVVAATVVLGLQFQLRRPYPDSDQFYHFGISRLSAEHGLLETLPQAAGLGWDRQFPDKEFLFHVFTTAAYRAGQERGVRLLSIAFAAAAAGALYLLCRGFVPAPPAALLSLGLLVLDPFFFKRLFLVRPHGLAVLLFVLLALGISRRFVLLSFAAACAYALAYHAIHLPLLVLLIHLCSTLLPGSQDWSALRRCCAAGIAGLAAGTLANPYFPDHLLLGWAHLQFAFQSGAGAAPVGSELVRVPPAELVMRSPLLFAGAALGLAASLAAAVRTRSLGAHETAGWAGCTAVFAAASFVNPRAIEYLIPLTALLGAMHLGRLQVRRQSDAALVVLLLFALQSGPFIALYFKSNKPSVNQGRLAAIGAVRALPENGRHALVFNCTFNTGPYLLHYRPNLRFLDLLDPRLYEQANPEGSRLRSQLVNGMIDDPYQVLREEFGASYIVCMRPALLEQLNADPRFARLYPNRPGQPGLVQSFRIERAE